LRHAAHPEASPKAVQEIIHLDGQAKQATRKEKVMTTRDIESKAKEYKEMTQFIKQLQDEADAIKAVIVAEMEAQGVDAIAGDLFTIKWSEYQSTRLDSTKLKAEHGDLYAAYSKTTLVKRFQVA
jgi:predicted phage-related endonuclease